MDRGANSTISKQVRPLPAAVLLPALRCDSPPPPSTPSTPQIPLVPSFSPGLQRLLGSRLPFSGDNLLGRTRLLFLQGAPPVPTPREVRRRLSHPGDRHLCDLLAPSLWQAFEEVSSCAVELSRGLDSLANKEQLVATATSPKMPPSK